MKWNNLILLVLIAPVFTACLKSTDNVADTNEKKFIVEARKFFDTSTVEGSSHAAIDYKSRTPRIILWGQTKSHKASGGYALIAPIEYRLPLFVKTEFSAGNVFHLNDLSQLLIYCDSNKKYHLEVLTRFPDTNYLKDPAGVFSGFVFVDDWWGNNLGKYLLEPKGIKTYHSTNIQTEAIIRTCNVIYGYNYSSGDPGGGYSWVQAGGCTYMYLPDRVDEIHGSSFSGGLGFSGGGGSGGGTGTTIAPAPPDNPIANIADYNKCFTNVGGSDHIYTVTVCVQQPIPGDRSAYKWVNGGPIGSSNEGNIVNVGHTFLIFSERYGNTTITRNVGFYPSSGVKPGSATAPGILNNDEAHSYNISGTFSVTSANFFIMLNSVGRGNDPGFNYNLSSENCTTFALQTLAQGGIYLPNTIGSWPGGMGCNPGDLGEDIKQMAPLPNMTRSTVQNYHPNIGGCQ
ncbi:MAG: hypothetical protein J0H74_34875 [Chitinophagaceae bacterium]|nr:hypothetical protein [Chitinophagaceae bacterium]